MLNRVKMKNKWCVYGNFFPILGFHIWGLGKIVEESPDKKSVRILYSEGQMYPAALWDSNYVKRFKTIKQAIEYNIERTDSGRQRLLERILSDFPSQKPVIQRLF